MNGKKLTKTQIKKVERIDRLFAELKAEGVEPMIWEGGGNPTLTFWRDADLYVDTLEKNRLSFKNVYHSTQTKIDMWVP